MSHPKVVCPTVEAEHNRALAGIRPDSISVHLMQEPPPRPRRIAVIGSGIGGLTAAWLL